MGIKSPQQPKETRVSNLREVSLGYGKKITQEEARRCPQCAQPTCLNGCPLGIDIPGFIRFLREGDAVSALTRIKLANPFPAICGRICPAPCERACIFDQEGSTLEIRTLERYAADFGQAKNEKKPIVLSKGKKVAIIGSGPSGLAAAHTFAANGFGVTIFESHDQAGGLLRYAIPEFRMPQKVLDEQIQELKLMGIEFRTNVFVGRTVNLSEILMQGYHAVLLAVGAGIPDFTHLPGENLGGVYYAEEFLMRLNARRKEEAFDQAPQMIRGLKTVVIGGGPAALDAARMAVRFGQETHLVFPGLEEQLDVHADDFKAAIEEGVIFEPLIEPMAIMPNEHEMASAVQCRRLELKEEEAGLLLAAVGESDISFEAETVILAHDRKPNSFLKTHLPQLKLTDKGAIWVDDQNGQTSIEHIYACGNVVTGAGPVVDAIKSGRDVALKIMKVLES